MEFTLLFNVERGPIQWHDENKRGNLFKSEAGREDPRGTGWVSTGITFESGEESWVYYICAIVDIAFKKRKNATKEEILRLVDYLLSFKQGIDLSDVERKYNLYNPFI